MLKGKLPKFNLQRSLVFKLMILIVVLLSGTTLGYFYRGQQKPKTIVEKNIYLAFLSEVYDKIQNNYWEKIPDEQLITIFRLGTEKLTAEPQALESNDKVGLEKLLSRIINKMESEEKKKEFTASLADIVLANLQPLGRSRLYSKKEEKALKNNVENINPEVNQYDVLGINKNASPDELKKAFGEKLNKLEKEKKEVSEPEKKIELENKTEGVKYAYQVLSDSENRKAYDVSGVEPTMDYRLIQPDIFYIYIKKLSPTSFDELKRVTEKVDNTQGLDSLILDLRDNVGGAIDLLPYLLGPFIGQDQYAYQFFHQGEKTDFKTKTGWLPSLARYKKVIILINEGTQSSAELMAATLKKYNLGVLVGTPTKGWGTIEKVFPVDQQIDPNEKYSVFLVHSLALRDDGQPIEGRGVEPMVNTNDAGWEKQLYSYFHYDELVKTVKNIISSS